jgi:Ca-activated chloride channel family protein
MDKESMMRGKLITRSGALLVSAVLSDGASAFAQQAQQPALATFRSSVDLVRVSAVVRDRRGRFVRNLKAQDFEVADRGVVKPIVDFRHDKGNISIALLFDVSGSMEGRLAHAREAATHLLSWLDAANDEAAVFTFDTRLEEVVPFTSGLTMLPPRLTGIVPFGATSLHDAIARTAEQLSDRAGRRRAIIVLTDGLDTASRLTPPEVSGIASSIDVPVYIVGVVPLIDNPAADEATSVAERSALGGDLASLAEWTGGRTAIVSTPAARSIEARQIIDEMRHQYLIAFESSGSPGWHPLVVRARGKDLTVRARSGYIAGQSRPISQ